MFVLKIVEFVLFITVVAVSGLPVTAGKFWLHTLFLILLIGFAQWHGSMTAKAQPNVEPSGS